MAHTKQALTDHPTSMQEYPHDHTRRDYDGRRSLFLGYNRSSKQEPRVA